MNAIYRCRTADNKVVEIDADTWDSVGIIKGLAKAVHGVEIMEVINEIQVSNPVDDNHITRLPDVLRNFIDKRMVGAKHLVCHFSSYVIKNNVKSSEYGFILKAMLQREKEEADEREQERLLVLASQEKRNEDRKVERQKEDRAARKDR